MSVHIPDLGFDHIRYAKDPDYRARVLETTEVRDLLAARAARTDVNQCTAYVFSVKQWPFHRALQNFFNENRLASVDAPIGHGKTFQVSIARTLYQLGRNHNENIALVSNSSEIPDMCLEVIKTNIEENERCHRVFPNLRVQRFARSKTGNLQLVVERPRSNLKDPSVVAIGLAGSIQGRRWSKMKTDDMLDLDSTWTEGSRAKSDRRFESDLLTRFDPEAHHEDVGTPWAVNDTRHKISAKPGYAYARFDAVTGLMHDKSGAVVKHIAEGGLWPELYRDPISKKLAGWPLERIEWARQNMTAEEFDRTLRCLARSGSLAVFKQEDLEYAKALGVRMGLDRMPCPSREGESVVTGIDLAVSKKDVADRTAFHTGTVREGPYGPTKCTLDVRSGRWEVREIMRQVLDTLRLYPNHAAFRVENNASQDYILQVLNDTDMARSVGFTDDDLGRMRIVPHTTTAKYKYDATVGVRGMALDFEQKRWAIPCGAEGMRVEKEIQLWLDGLLAFDPTSHTSDQVMCSWMFCEQARAMGMGGSGSWQEFGIG